ncbi:right-handed parallel beta-helix repeat-containing protein [Algibacter sp. L1A34]|uniref:right-handed parallel beta-helix repeat-containing protein n=1 Tax=Algibacter sp. L1A34 TaxID=2686365 RepID=UPI00131C6203|nr:right-handed parallel beta-helix repeat-containing protein [Algibacter sp. L1A34]
MKQPKLLPKYLFGLIILFSLCFITACDSGEEKDDKVIENEEEVIEEEVVLNYDDDILAISTIDELRKAVQLSGKTINMKAGEYVVSGTMPEDPKTIFHFSGSNNVFNFEGVTIIIPTSVLRNMGPGNTHEFATYRIDGSNLVFNGGDFENTGEERPYKSLAEFEVHGNDISFLGCNFIIKGSAPYGYGDLYGKGSDHYVGLYKHSAMSILGDDVLVDGCDFKVFSFGHGIHIHGSQNTIIRNVTMEGARRLTDEIYEETSGPAYDYGFKIYFPELERGLPIRKGEMISLTEDGIRAYLDGDDVNGVNRRTGDITVENCFVDKMRGGITLSIGSGASNVSNNTVVNCEHAYSFPSNAVVKNCKGNTAFGPLLMLPYDHKKNSDIELELIDSEVTMGNHPFAQITGSGHQVKFTYNGTKPNENLRPIWIGVAEDWGDNDERTEEDLKNTYSATSIELNNETNNPVLLGEYSKTSIITSVGEVVDEGESNIIN